MSKIFVIGFHRTGTRSVNAALQHLGYDVIHYPCPSTNEMSCDEIKNGPPWPIIDKCDGLSDIVTIPFHQRLYDEYPNSKFILTIRKTNEWLRSVKSHLENLKSISGLLSNDRILFDKIIHSMIYGADCVTDEERLRLFMEHNTNVTKQYNSSELLVFDVCHGWPLLCQFLKVEIPPFKFPKIK